MSGDLISRQAVLDLIEHYNSDGLGSVFYGYEEGEKFANAVKKLSPVNTQEPAAWCTDCKEYDQDEHCCHRFSKVIRDTVEEMKQESVYFPPCVDCNTKMNEIREAYDKLKNQEPKMRHCMDCKWWKDSDGAYRRGIGAESQCPINRREVLEGNGYCYMFDPRESEVK